ncbi:MAG: hypothetical protein LQ345_002309 [Seirophora villosa]|nr:MAG: hypothetical protein LQ345_002309 [Seirophora villosa]
MAEIGDQGANLRTGRPNEIDRALAPSSANFARTRTDRLTIKYCSQAPAQNQLLYGVHRSPGEVSTKNTSENLPICVQYEQESIVDQAKTQTRIDQSTRHRTTIGL